MREVWAGFYLDGRTAQRQPAEIRLTPDGVLVTIERGGSFRWGFGELRQTQGFHAGEQIRVEPRRGSGALVVRDLAFLTALRQASGAQARRFHDPARRRLYRPMAALTALAVLALVATVYVWVIPAAAVVVAPRVPLWWEERLGQAAVDYFVPADRRCQDETRMPALDAIVATLVAAEPMSPYRFRIIVADYPVVNAFAAPGGNIVVFRGLLERTEDAEELAGVLAHELQHVLRRHVARTVVQQASTGLLLAGLTGDASGLLALEVARTLGHLRYSRQYEREADAEGIRMLRRAGIEPEGMIRFFQRLQGEEVGSAPKIPAYLATHPSSQERVTELRALAASPPAPPGKLLPAYDWADVRSLCHVAASAPAPRSTPPTPPGGLSGTGRVYLVPLGPVPDGMLDDLVAYHRDRIGLRIETLPSVAFVPDVFDPSRRQVIAEEVVALMRRRTHELVADPEAILIGITTHDMYVREYRWRFAFAYRGDSRFAVVSAARMDPRALGEPPDPERLAERLRKMVTRQIGILHFRLPESPDPGSVMYGAIRGVDDLDRLGEEF